MACESHRPGIDFRVEMARVNSADPKIWNLGAHGASAPNGCHRPQCRVQRLPSSGCSEPPATRIGDFPFAISSLGGLRNVSEVDSRPRRAPSGDGFFLRTSVFMNRLAAAIYHN